MPELTATGAKIHYTDTGGDGTPVLLDFGEPTGFDLSPWADRVRSVTATHDSVWELPVLGQVAAPAAVLIRPDGYIAWVGSGTDTGLRDALTTWFGSAEARSGVRLESSWQHDRPGGELDG